VSRFWTLWIVGLTVANIAFAVILLLANARPGKDPQAKAETSGHIWDRDLRELNNPLPLWWLGLFVGTVIFGLVYLALYPGLGSYPGSLHWSVINDYNRDVARADAASAAALAQFNGKDIAALQASPAAMQVASHLFAANCAICHGSDARGASGFPNLTAANWQWGRDPATVEQTIGGGRIGVMPAWKAAVGADGVEELMNYVLSLSGPAPNASLVAAGEKKFALYCVACHGADGKGNTLLGAPNLTDENWLYGGSPDVVRKTIADGRQNQMPAHLERLGPLRIKLLAAYVLGLRSPHAVASLNGASTPSLAQ